MRRILYIMATLALVIGLMPVAGVVAGDIGDVFDVGNIAFVPNSGEASVSRVDLETYEEIARYYTAPRENPDPIAWRTSRIALDDDYNAWVLNVGADGTNLQGSVVRIQADTEGLDTHEYPADVYEFGTDEAVQVFPVGDPGDMPRAIAIDGDGYIWVGFYSGAQLMKYDYDEAAEKLTAVGGPFYPDLTPDNKVIRYYEMKFAPDGTLFISSRGSTPTRTPRQEGIWAFNPESEEFVRETEFDPYSILIAPDGTVYATAYSDELHIRDTDGNWTSVTVGGPQNRGMGFDGAGNVWIAATTGPQANVFGGNTVYSYNPLTGAPGPTYTLTEGTTPVGVGRDVKGNMWVVCRTDGNTDGGFIEGFSPSDQSKVGAIQVGYRPYAYGDFAATLTLYRICGYKYLAEWDEVEQEWVCEEGIEGWWISLYRLADGGDPNLGHWELVDEDGLGDDYSAFNPVQTGADGMYCFLRLPAGIYKVVEEERDGYDPVGETYHVVDVPGEATDPSTMEPLYNFCNAEEPDDFYGCTPGYWKNNAERRDAVSWDPTGYDPDDLFSGVFGEVIEVRGRGRHTIEDPTLLEALSANGGGINALARHAVAALLNAAHPDVNYSESVAYVIAATQAAIEAEDYEGQKDEFEKWNELGCSIDMHGNPIMM